MGSAVKTFYSSFKFKRRPKTRRVLSLFFLIVAGGTCFPLTTEVAEAATTYYLDAVNGDDSYPGTSGLPWQTLAKAQTTASAGDTVYLFGGSYGNFDETDVTRTDWLTYKAVDGQTPVFTRIHIARGSLGDVYLIFDGITVNCSADDGEHLSLSKCRYVKFLNMSINAPGYTTGDYTKTMPLWSSEYVTIDNCTFTGTGADYEGGRMYAVRGSLSNHIYVTNCTMNQHGKGIVADGDYWTVTNNHIYNMDADGIIIVNCNNCLVAYNHIHDLEPAPGSGEHVDLIQVNYAVSHNVTIRGNNCYNSERQGFFINPQTASNYLIENNLVHSCNMYGGASNEVTVHNINGITFRNNTIDGNLLGGGPAVWTQLCNNIVKRLDINVDGGTSIQYENYNFIRYWWIHMTTHRPGVNSVTLNTDEAFYSLFADAQNGDYQLHDASPAKDFCLAAISPAYDLLGNLRDATPDAGCYEYISGPTDTTPPPPPQNLSATPVSESQIDLSWQASVDPESGISHYKVYRDGSPVGTSVSPAYSDTGLNPGTTYSYQVSAVNGGGLESNRSTTAQAATPLDTTPPEIVSVLASETQVSISFSEALDTPSAEDTANYSITGGVSIISASLSATLAEVTLTTSAHAEGTYTLTVINVKDRNGNPLPQTSINYEYSEGLAGYWKFDEGEGLQAIDSSGMGNTGTLINGPAWTSGKVGGALSFDGFDDYVQIGATDVAVPWAAALWVRRADSSNSNAALLESSGYSLKLEQYPDTNKLGFTAFGVGDYTFNYEAPVGAWVHLVFVATATETNLYVNGILTDTIPYSVPCPMGQISSASPSRPAKGLIDEVRIYNRVLTGAEILDLYNEGAAQDTTAPVISNVQASDISDSGATITWTTDENATSQVEYGLDTSYGSSTNADTNLVMSHLILLGGLAPGTLYHYRVRSKDAAANESVSEDKTFSTTTAVTYNLVVTAVHGTVVRSPDKASYSYGETVILEAVPDTGYHFVDWSGAVTGSSNPVSVVMDWDKSVVASFAVNTYTLGITAENGTVVRSPDKASYSYGETVVLEAVADTGYHFVDWSGAVTGGGNPVSVVMDGDKSVVASFAVNTYTLGITAENGTVVRSPDKASYSYGETVILEAVPDTGYHFVDWSGAVTSGSNPVSVVMDADKSVVASFAVNTYTLGITAENGVVVRNPDKASYNYGETVVLEAVPDTGYHFVDWSGAVTGGSNPVSVVMDADKSITANFGVSIIDQNAPTVTNCLPAAGAIQVPINNLMILDVVDAGTGVDGNSVTIRVNNNLVYAGNTEDYVSVYGRCRRTGAEAAYTFVYQSNEVFDFDYKVSVAVNAKDLVGNTMEEYVYSFATEMCSFGVNKKVNSSLDGSHEEMPATVRDDSGNVWVVWQAGPEGGRDIHVGKLVPGAVFFSESVRITNSVDDQCSPDIAVGTDGRLYVVWQDNRRGNWDIYISISTDGTNWSLERIVTDSNDNQINPAIVVDRLSPNRAHIVWQDGRNGNQDIYIATSSNGFLSKTVSQITSDGSDQVEPAIAVDADNVVYVVWADTRADSGDIYGAASNYGPWANTVVVSKGGRQSSPAIAAESSGSILHVLWIDDTPGDSDIFYAGTEGGLPATPLTGRSVIDDTSGADQLEPAIVVTGSSGSNLRVFACWKDERNLGGGSQDTDLYFVVIGELSSTNVFVTDDGTNANQSSPAIDVDEHGYPYLVWVDDRNDGRDVYYAGSSYAGPDVLASQDVSISAGAIVGTDPEAITGVQDVSITIPAGAFVCDLKISISSVENPQNLGFERLSLPYEFGPSGVHFSQPATITIPYEVPGPGWSASAYWYNPLTGTLSQQGIADIETMVISPTLHALRFKTAHLTQFLVGGIESGSTGGGGGGGGGCSMSRCAQVSATEFLLPYVGLALAMVIIRLRDGGTRKLHEC